MIIYTESDSLDIDELLALFVAIVVRNNLEDFHVRRQVLVPLHRLCFVMPNSQSAMKNES